MTASRNSSVPRLVEWSVLAMLVMGFVAITSSGLIDALPAAIGGAAIAARILIAAGVLPFFVPSKLANGLALAALGAFPLDYYFYSHDVVGSALRLVRLAAAIHILRARTRRDFLFVKLIALAMMLAGAILPSGTWFLLLLLAFAAVSLVAQLSGEIWRNLDLPIRIAPLRGSSVIRGLLLAAIPLVAGIGLLAIVLFLVLPRTARAALPHLMSAAAMHLPGFSNEVRLGQLGRIIKTSTPVMHARIAGDRRVPGIKWRGSALAEFDGRRWFNRAAAAEQLLVESGSVQLAPRQQLWQRGERISYEVHLKNVTGNVLFFPGSPELLRVDAHAVFRSPVDSFRVSGTPVGGLRYAADSLLAGPRAVPRAPAAALSPGELQRYLALPNLDPRIAELAQKWTRMAGSDSARASAIEQHLRNDYGYSLDLLPEEVPDPLAHFLFTRKQGHCEYFASSMAVMLRTLGVPSRVATGFQAGVYNPFSGWHVIRASDAHSWVEAHIEGYGWVTFDPTPAAPARANSWVTSQAWLYLDALDVFLQQWVVNYDIEHQLSLAERMGQSGRTFSIAWFDRWVDAQRKMQVTVASLDGERVAAIALGVIALVAAAAFLPRARAWWSAKRRVKRLRNGQGEPSDATLLYQRMLAALARRGIEKPAWMTPAEFTRHVPAGPWTPLVANLTASYNAVRFGGHPEDAPRLVELVEELERQAR